MLVERTSLSLRELLEGNVGAEVIVNETPLSGAATQPRGTYLRGHDCRPAGAEFEGVGGDRSARRR